MKNEKEKMRVYHIPVSKQVYLQLAQNKATLGLNEGRKYTWDEYLAVLFSKV